jgi:hypothetical protein
VKRAWLYRKVVLPVVELLRQGITPEKIALSIALGAVIGVFPVFSTRMRQRKLTTATKSTTVQRGPFTQKVIRPYLEAIL